MSPDPWECTFIRQYTNYFRSISVWSSRETCFWLHNSTFKNSCWSYCPPRRCQRCCNKFGASFHDRQNIEKMTSLAFLRLSITLKANWTQGGSRNGTVTTTYRSGMELVKYFRTLWEFYLSLLKSKACTHLSETRIRQGDGWSFETNSLDLLSELKMETCMFNRGQPIMTSVLK